MKLKSIISLLFIFFIICGIASAQFQGNQGLSSATTLLTINGGTKATFGLTLGDFTDTTTANLNAYMKGVPGLMIRAGNIIWQRNTTANAWIKLINSSYYSFSNLLTENPSGTVKFGGSATGNTVSNMGNFRFAIDSGKLILNTSVLNAPDSALSVVRGSQRLFNVSMVDGYTTVDQLMTLSGAFYTTGVPSVVFQNNRLQLNGGSSYIQGFQQSILVEKSYPLADDSIAIRIVNDTLGAKNSDSTFYHPFQIDYTSSVDNIARTKYYINGAGKQVFNATNTAGGTTGNQTINKPTGTVNIAAAATTVTVTNSLCTTSSIVYAVVRTADNTASIKNVVPGAGSFVINLGAAATAEVSIGFLVIN